MQRVKSHPSRVRELKLIERATIRVEEKSHPSRVRELKLLRAAISLELQLSHPSRVRELKQRVRRSCYWPASSRTPPGCVN